MCCLREVIESPCCNNCCLLLIAKLSTRWLSNSLERFSINVATERCVMEYLDPVILDPWSKILWNIWTYLEIFYPHGFMNINEWTGLRTWFWTQVKLAALLVSIVFVLVYTATNTQSAQHASIDFFSMPVQLLTHDRCCCMPPGHYHTKF